MKKKVLVILFVLFFVRFSIEWVVRGAHFFIFDSGSYLSFVRPILHWVKYLGVAFVLVVLLKKYATLTEAGKIFSLISFVVIVLAFLTASLWFNAVNEETIVKQRVFSQDVYTWEDVEFVSTDIYRKNNTGSRRTNPSRKLIVKYNIHVEDGSVINVWNNIDSIFELHQFVLDKGIDVEYLYDRDGDAFDSSYTSEFKRSMDKARDVFGVE